MALSDAAALEHRLARVEAVLDIMRLKAEYAACADAKYTDAHRKLTGEALDAVAARQAGCFTEDGEFTAGAFGSARGRAELFENFRGKPFQFSMHLYVNPIIEVDEGCHTATGCWTLWMTATDGSRGERLHGIGYNVDRYRREPDGWRIARLEATFKFLVPFTADWGPVNAGLAEAAAAAPAVA